MGGDEVEVDVPSVKGASQSSPLERPVQRSRDRKSLIDKDPGRDSRIRALEPTRARSIEGGPDAVAGRTRAKSARASGSVVTWRPGSAESTSLAGRASTPGL